MAFNWHCPFCSTFQTVTAEKRYSNSILAGDIKAKEGMLVLSFETIGCSNPDCNRATVKVAIGKDHGRDGYRIDPKAVYFNRQLIPEGVAKPQPIYIPQPIVEDYNEACLIADFSPKASATLARRCIQGMIRDFCGISKSTLYDEISALRKALDDGTADRSISPESVDALDHVRKIGNIGAHMQKEIDRIVTVEPDEAKTLIELVELLFAEWYIARKRRTERFEKLAQIAQAKDAEKSGDVQTSKPAS